MAKREAKDQLSKEIIVKGEEKKPKEGQNLDEADAEMMKAKMARAIPKSSGEKDESPGKSKESWENVQGLSKFLQKKEEIGKKPEEDKQKQSEQKKGSIFGTGFFGNYKSPFSQTQFQTQDPKKSEQVASFLNSGTKPNQISKKVKEEDDEEEDERSEEEDGKANLLVADDPNENGEGVVPSISEKPLEPSPYEKLITMKVAKFKVEGQTKGIGVVSIEKESGSNRLVLLIFRNNLGKLLYQGQFVKKLTKFIKYKNQKAEKIQRMITTIGKKENGTNGVLKCTITFHHEKDCELFRKTFYNSMDLLPAEEEKNENPETKKDTPIKADVPNEKSASKEKSKQ